MDNFHFDCSQPAQFVVVVLYITLDDPLTWVPTCLSIINVKTILVVISLPVSCLFARLRTVQSMITRENESDFTLRQSPSVINKLRAQSFGATVDLQQDVTNMP